MLPLKSTRQLRKRSGFSLLGMMVVLGLIVVVASMAAPSLMDRMRDTSLHGAADQVREILSEARTFAIDSGIDYQFRYEPEGQWFVVLPTEIEPSAANSVNTDSGSAEYMRLSGELEEDHFLRGAKDETDIAEHLESSWFSGLGEASTLASKGWSAPIYFRFDGSATDRTFRVMDKDGRTAELTVRGLTGAVRMSGVYTEQEP